MITEEEYRKAKAIVDQYHEERQRIADQELEDELDFELGDDDDEDAFEGCEDCGKMHCVCEYVSNCTCGAWVMGPNGAAHVADCICGGGL